MCKGSPIHNNQQIVCEKLLEKHRDLLFKTRAAKEVEVSLFCTVVVLVRSVLSSNLCRFHYQMINGFRCKTLSSTEMTKIASFSKVHLFFMGNFAWVLIILGFSLFLSSHLSKNASCACETRIWRQSFESLMQM